MNDFTEEKRLAGHRNAENEFYDSVHTHKIKSLLLVEGVEVRTHMRKLTIGIFVVITALVVTAGVVTAHAGAGAAIAGTMSDEHQEDCDAVMDDSDDCPMTDGMMGMMGDNEMSDDCPMDDGMMDGMMGGSSSGMSCH